MNKIWIVGFILAVASYAHHTGAQAAEFKHYNHAPYASIALGYKLAGSDLFMADKQCTSERVLSDVIQTQCAEVRRNPSTQIEIGYEVRVSEYFTVSAGYQHQSQLLQGWPFNDNDAEFYADQVFIRLRVGGVR